MKKVTAVSLGLFAAWALHDAEEWATMAGQGAAVMKRVPTWVPLPDNLRERGLTKAQYESAILVMAGLMAAASVAGARTGGGLGCSSGRWTRTGCTASDMWRARCCCGGTRAGRRRRPSW